MSRSSLMILDPLPEAAVARFASHAGPDFAVGTAASRLMDDQMTAITAAPFAITGDAPVTRAMFEAGARAGLKAVHKWGVGFDAIDLAAARDCGVRVLRTTGANAVPVAETTVGLMLALLRNLMAGHVSLQEGRWLKPQLGPRCGLLSGKTVGLIGFGAIGQATARALSGFGCPILYTKTTPVAPEIERALNARFVDRATLLAQADIVSLHCALTPQTANMIDADNIATMKPGALFVNTARGGLVDESAMAEAVRTGHLGGAAFDVFSHEPLQAGDPLRGHERILTIPHLGGTAAEIYGATVQRMLANLRAVELGQPVDAGDVLV